MTDPIADMLTRIQNALRARQEEVVMPHSNQKEALANIMKEHGYLLDIETQGEGAKKNLLITLNQEFRSLRLRRKSSPGQRITVAYRDIPKNTRGHGLTVISTSKGLLSAQKALAEKVGGEILCEMY